MEPWTPSDEWIDRINQARRFFNKPAVIMVIIVFNWVVVAVSMFLALRDGDGMWLMMAIFWTIFAAYIGPRQYQIAKMREQEESDAATTDRRDGQDDGMRTDVQANAPAHADAKEDR